MRVAPFTALAAVAWQPKRDAAHPQERMRDGTVYGAPSVARQPKRFTAARKGRMRLCPFTALAAVARQPKRDTTPLQSRMRGGAVYGPSCCLATKTCYGRSATAHVPWRVYDTGHCCLATKARHDASANAHARRRGLRRSCCRLATETRPWRSGAAHARWRLLPPSCCCLATKTRYGSSEPRMRGGGAFRQRSLPPPIEQTSVLQLRCRPCALPPCAKRSPLPPRGQCSVLQLGGCEGAGLPLSCTCRPTVTAVRHRREAPPRSLLPPGEETPPARKACTGSLPGLPLLAAREHKGTGGALTGCGQALLRLKLERPEKGREEEMEGWPASSCPPLQARESLPLRVWKDPSS